MLNVKIDVDGDTIADLLDGIDEARRRIEDGNTSGHDRGENGRSYAFVVEDTPSERSAERKKLLCDVFITALEGGIGYWSQAIEYHWSLPHTALKTVDEAMDIEGFYADIIDGEDGDHDHHIDADVIERGIKLIASGAMQIRSDILATVAALNVGADVDYDGETADCIVQAGLFGEVVYG